MTKDKKPQITTLLLKVEKDEFIGDSGASDQVFWRKRPDSVFAKILAPDQTFQWRYCQFSQFVEFGAEHSWDGTIILLRPEMELGDSVLEKLGGILSNIEKVHALQGSAEFEGVEEGVKKGFTEYQVAANTAANDYRQITTQKQLDEYLALMQTVQKRLKICGEEPYLDLFQSEHRPQVQTKIDGGLKTISTFLADVNGVMATYTDDAKKRIKLPPLAASWVGRAVVCSSFEGEWASITVRGDSIARQLKLDEPVRKHARSLAASDWKQGIKERDADKKSEFLFSFGHSVEAIAEQIFQPSPLAQPLTGLIVVMGETGTGKSQIAYGLMHHYLTLRSEHGGGAFGHVVTLEDPIEKKFYKNLNYPTPVWKVGTLNEYHFHYTARHKKLDCTLKSGLSDALRQKPTVLYAGEIREQDEWRLTLDFAATGHLVMATAHAGSLSESFGKLLRACDAGTPARRGEEASKILGLVHLSPYTLQGVSANLITIWRRSQGGANGLISEGLSSIVPHNSENRGSLGAQFMFRSMEKLHDKLAAPPDPAAPARFDYSPILQEFRDKALKRDLTGI